MTANVILGALAILSLLLTAWQWVVGRAFPLHRRPVGPSAVGRAYPRADSYRQVGRAYPRAEPDRQVGRAYPRAESEILPKQLSSEAGQVASENPPAASPGDSGAELIGDERELVPTKAGRDGVPDVPRIPGALREVRAGTPGTRPYLEAFPGITILKPVKGCDAETARCFRSWLAQDYPGPLQFLFAVADASDPVCEIIRRVLAEFPERDARLVICQNLIGTNAKVAKLAQLERITSHEMVCISDADVLAPPDLLRCIAAEFEQADAGLVNCFYELANPTTLAMQLEAVAINSDFWTQTLQARSLGPLDFALGATMVTRRDLLAGIGGFAALRDCLADDYQLGHRIAARGGRVLLCPAVVQCFEEPMNWRAVWKHQLRWARTIRVSQPLPYFFSILANSTLWPLLWVAIIPSRLPVAVAAGCILFRILTSVTQQARLTHSWRHAKFFWLVPCKDLFAAAIWLQAFLGNRIEWAGRRMILRRDGTLAEGEFQSTKV